MKKRQYLKHNVYYIIVLLFLIPSFSFSQTRSCSRERDKAIARIPSLYHENRHEKIYSILEKWKRDCTPNEELFRIETLLKISSGTFYEDSLDKNIIGYLLAFQEKSSQALSPYYNSLSFHQNDPETKKFDRFTAQLARSLLKNWDLTPTERSIVSHYAGVSRIWGQLSVNGLHGTRIQDYFNQLKKDALARNFNLTAFGGIWIPVGRKALFKENYEAGIKIGTSSSKCVFDMGVGALWSNSSGTYHYLYEDSLNVMKLPLQGFGVSAELGKMERRTAREYFDIRGGINFNKYFTDTYYSLDKSRKKDNVEALTLGVSTNYKYFYSVNNFLGAEFKVNFPPLNLPEKTGVSFLMVNFRVLWGFSHNRVKKGFLKKLHL